MGVGQMVHMGQQRPIKRFPVIGHAAHGNATETNPVVTPFPANQPRTESPMERWLGHDCFDAAVHKRQIAELRRIAPRATRYFIRLVVDGPDRRLMAVEHAALREFYAKRQRFLADGERKIRVNSGRQIKDRPEPITQKQYVAERLKYFRIRLQVRAIEGLAVLKTDESEAFLKKLSADRQNPLGRIAADYLRDGR